MTPRQMAAAAAADLKWLTNSAALLRRPLRYNREAARWWGLVRVLVDELGLTLKAAAEAATSTLASRSKSPKPPRTSRSSAPAPAPARVQVDLPLYDSIFLANLSQALVHETPRRRGRVREVGRDAIAAASRYGIDLGLLETSLQRTPAERLALLDSNVSFLRSAAAVK